MSKSAIKQLVLATARRSTAIQRVSAFITTNLQNGSEIQNGNSVNGVTTPSEPIPRDTYQYLKAKFIENGRDHKVNEITRVDIVRRFEDIDREVPIGSTPTDGLFLAEMLLNVDAPGTLVECGCYAGGSSSKLSIIASLLDRKVIVFDSFEGLPEVDSYFLRDAHCRRNDDWVTDWTAGRYASHQSIVEANIGKYGEFSHCSFIKGWFSESMTSENLPEQIAFAFVDVDLANSARDCFTAIWPRLSENGIFVTHDTAYIKVLQQFYDPEIWKAFGEIPPILFGAGFGLCNESPHIGYMVKESQSPNYLKSLTIDK